MALNARFGADFEDFKKGVDEADVRLGSFQKSAETVARDLGRVSSAYDGTRTIAEATRTVAIIEKLGGASNLTASEQARANRVLEEAVQKFNVLGEQAPEDMVRLAAETRGAGESVGFLDGTVGNLIKGFFAVETARAAFNFGKDVLESTAQIQDLSDATQVSTDFLQRAGYISDDFGVSMEEMGRAVQSLSERLASGDASAVSRVQQLGLSVKALVAAGPEEAFLSIAEAVGRLDDPMQKNAFAADLFGGKLGKVLIPTLSDLRQKMDEVPKGALISSEAIKSADEFDEALTHLEKSFKAILANSDVGLLIKFLAKDLDSARASTQGAADATDAHAAGMAKYVTVAAEGVDATTATISAADRMKNALIAWRSEGLEPLTAQQRTVIEQGSDLNKSISEMAQVSGASEAAVQRYATAYKAIQEEQKKFKASLEELQSAGQGWQGTLATINGSVVEAIRYYLQAGVSQGSLAQAYGLTATQVRAVQTALQDEVEAQKRADAAAAATMELWNEYSEVVGTQGATAYEKQIAAIDKWAADLSLRMQQAKQDTQDFYDALEATVAAKKAALLVDWDALSQGSRKSLEEAALKAENTYQRALAASDQYTPEQIANFEQLRDVARKAYEDWGTTAQTVMTKTAETAKATAEQIKAATLSWSEGMDLARQGKGTMSGTLGQGGWFQATRQQVDDAAAAGRYWGPVDDHGRPDYARIGLAGARALGGRVDAGHDYLVGELGAEVFRPDRSGTILPNAALGMASGGTNVTVVVNAQGAYLDSPAALQRLANMTKDALLRDLRAQGRGLPLGA